MAQALVFTPEPGELMFTSQRSELTGKFFLETSFVTALGELAVITAEEKEGHALGTILIGNRIYGVANVSENEPAYLDKCAKLALNIAVREFSEDLWPDPSVIALYRSISKHSSSREILAPGGLVLSESAQSGAPQLFKGSTSVGTHISISVAYGYAVAQADLKRSSKIVYETSVPTPLFRSEEERNLFAAKAFGELVAAKV